MSVPFRVGDARDWTGGELLQGSADAVLSGASTDSRTLAGGELFVAIVGPNHDGHDHLAAAVAGGASGLVVETGRALPAGLDPALPVLAVRDTTRALGALAAGHRAGFAGPVVAITGSNGKTTTKEMCAAILELGAPTLRTRGNLNNQYGLPLTLLAREPEHERAVVELGTNHPGEIADLAAIARPSVAVVTNVGTAHIEFLGSRDGIAREKGDLLAALGPDGVAVVNADDEYVDALAARSPGRVVRFGRAASADVRAEDVECEQAGFAFTLRAPEGRAKLRVAGLGEPTVSNALAAAAAALAAGASLDEVSAGLAAYRGLAGRLERRELPGGVAVIDDSYNANPQSTEVALRLLARCEPRGRRVAVLGDMGELGSAAEKAHREAGCLAAQLGIDWLVAVGGHAAHLAAGAREGGMAGERILEAPDSEAAGATLRGFVAAGDLLLLKGSRSMRMERVADALAEVSG